MTALGPTRGLVTFGEAMGLISATGIGSLDLARDARIWIGGAEGNVAMGVARLGMPATWIGRVGDDAVARLVTRQLRAAGVRTVAITDPSYTGLMVRHHRTANAIQIDYHRNGSAGSRLRPDDLDPQELAGAGVLHVTGITPALSESARSATFHAVDLARARGVTVSLDVNYRAKLWTAEQATPVLRELAARSDLLFAGPAEARLLCRNADRDRADPARSLADLGPTCVVIKDGPEGCVAWDGAAELRRAAVPVDRVVDPVGAGDAFVAGFLAEYLAGCPLERCLDTAVLMGAFAVSVPGDCELLPTRAELRAFAAATDVTR